MVHEGQTFSTSPCSPTFHKSPLCICYCLGGFEGESTWSSLPSAVGEETSKTKGREHGPAKASQLPPSPHSFLNYSWTLLYPLRGHCFLSVTTEHPTSWPCSLSTELTADLLLVSRVLFLLKHPVPGHTYCPALPGFKDYGMAHHYSPLRQPWKVRLL